MKNIRPQIMPLAAITAVALAMAAAAASEASLPYPKKIHAEIKKDAAPVQKANTAPPEKSETVPLARHLGDDQSRAITANENKESDDRKTEGIFSGIAAGDYAHFKLRESDGTERSFFILQTDAAIDRVLADPQKYEGRTCRVRWERRSENIPEAGGSMEIDVLLGVEWR